MLNKKLPLLLVVALITVAAADACGGEPETPEIVFSDFPTNVWGAKLSFKFKEIPVFENFFGNKKTSLNLNTELKGGWLPQYSYYSGSFEQRAVPSPDFDYTDTKFRNAFVQSKLGVKQKLLVNKKNGSTLVEGFTYLKTLLEGHYPYNGNDSWFMSLTDNPEKDGIFQNSIITGTTYDNTTRNRHGVKKGIKSQITMEYAPTLINNTADYYCTVFDIEGYLPIADIYPQIIDNTFSVYLADRIKTAYTDGDYRPYNIRHQNAAAVRGIERERFDSKFTAVNNMEIRCNLPSLFFKDIKFGILAYFDSGYYYEDSSYNGTIFSAGTGIYLDLFGYFQGGLRYDHLINETRMDETTSSINAMLTFYY